MSDVALNEYGARLSRLEDHAMSTERRLDEHNSKLDLIHSAVTKQELTPKFSFGVALSYIKDVGLLTAMAGAAIIYISSNISSAPIAIVKAEHESSMALVQKDLAMLNRRLDSAEFARNWGAKVEKP
jgi:hypothetical protein